MDKKYRVIFLRLLDRHEDFKKKMSVFGVSNALVDKIVNKAPVILKGEMTLGEARQYADVLQNAGGKVNIQEYGTFPVSRRINRPIDIEPLANFTICQECGYKQIRAELCEKCGSPLTLVEEQREIEND